MKKLVYLFLFGSFFMVSCSQETNTTDNVNALVKKDVPQPCSPCCPCEPAEPEDPICPEDCINDEIDNSSLSNNPLDDSHAYDFRDNFLSLYSTGDKYIEYYHAISTQTTTEFIIANFSDCYDFAVATHAVASVLENGDGNSIVITQDYYDDAMDMIELYRNEADCPDFDILLDDIEADLDDYKGITKDELIGILENS